MLDFHSHLIPGVDDGSPNLETSRVAIATMQAQGVKTIITTPHLRASLLTRPIDLEDYFELVDSAWEALAEMVAIEFPKMRLERGFEIMLDTPQINLSDPRLRLGGSRFVLVEFPFAALPPNSSQVLSDIKVSGYHPIVAHPERYADMDSELEIAKEWKRVGAALQVNAGSLVGMYRPRAEKLAWKLLRRGMADYISSDFHARGEPQNKYAVEALKRIHCDQQIDLLTHVNPNGILLDRAPSEVPPIPREEKGWRKWWPLRTSA